MRVVLFFICLSLCSCAPISDKHLQKAKEHANSLKQELSQLRLTLETIDKEIPEYLELLKLGQTTQEFIDQVLDKRDKVAKRIKEVETKLDIVQDVITEEQEKRESGGNPSPLWGFLGQLLISLIKRKD